MPGVWVYAEITPEGKVEPSALEILTKAQGPRRRRRRRRARPGRDRRPRPRSASTAPRPSTRATTPCSPTTWRSRRPTCCTNSRPAPARADPLRSDLRLAATWPAASRRARAPPSCRTRPTSSAADYAADPDLRRHEDRRRDALRPEPEARHRPSRSPSPPSPPEAPQRSRPSTSKIPDDQKQAQTRRTPRRAGARAQARGGEGRHLRRPRAAGPEELRAARRPRRGDRRTPRSARRAPWSTPAGCRTHADRPDGQDGQARGLHRGRHLRRHRSTWSA